MAKAGSWSIGFSPRPSDGIGNKYSKGFDVKIINNKNPKIINCWNIVVKYLYLLSNFFEVKT